LQSASEAEAEAIAPLPEARGLPAPAHGASPASVQQEVTLLRAVFVRTLKPGVSYEQFTDAWAPPSDEAYPATVRVARNLANDRQVMTILELDMSMTEFEAVRAR
jgi:hypothetical protein